MTKKGYTKPEAAKLLTREQVKDLLLGPRTAGALRDYYLLGAMYYLGRRIGEAVLLQPRHFENLDYGEAVVPILKRLRKHRCKPSCKPPCEWAGKRRWPKGMPKDELTGLPLKKIPIVDGQRLLRGMLDWAGSAPWIFPGKGGGHIRVRRAQAIFRTWADAAGIPKAVTPHSLRHTATSYAVAAGGIAVGRDLAAHANIATTDRYVRSTAESLKKARGSLSAPP